MSGKTNAVLVVAIAVSLGGCADYLNRHDSVTLGAGNALEANKGIHTIKPFPKEAWDTDIDGDPERTVNAVRQYKQRPPPKAVE